MTAQSSNVLIYNPINGRSLAYLLSVNTPDFQGRSDVLINPVLPSGIPLEFTKVVNSLVVPLSASESNAVVSTNALLADISLRNGADSFFVELSPNPLMNRSVADTAVDEINILRNEISVAKTNISKFQSTPTLAPRTLAQFRNSVTNKNHSGSVDVIAGQLNLRSIGRQVKVKAPKYSHARL